MVEIGTVSKIRTFYNYIIVIFTILGVSPFFATAISEYLFCLLVFLIIISLRRKQPLFDKKILEIIFIVYLLIAIQCIIYKGFTIAFFYVPLIVFYIPYLIYKLLGFSFFGYFVKVMFVIAIITTPLWALQSLYLPFDLFLREAIEWVYPYGWNITPRSLLIYTAAWDDYVFNESLGIYRNSGLFHEPGAYGIFLNTAIIFNTFVNGKRFDNKNIIFIFCVLTTLSTTGYITLFVIISSFLFQQRLNFFVKIGILMMFIVFSYKTYQSEEFLQTKIQKQYVEQNERYENEEGKKGGASGRFFAFFTAFDLFLDHPIIGRGIISATNEKATGEMNINSSYIYGFVGMLATYGLLFALFYIYFFYWGIKRIARFSQQSNLIVILIFFALNASLSTQVFFTTGTFSLIFMVGVYSPKYYSLVKENSIKA